jgi:hypothetical protein
MATDYSQLHRDRWMESGLEEYLHRLCDDEDSRRIAVTRLAESIEEAHSLSPQLWGLTKDPKYARLNFGEMLAISWTKEFFTLTVDLPTLETTASGELTARARCRRKKALYFREAPNSRYLDLPMDDHSRFSAELTESYRAHRAHLEVAASSRRNGSTQKGHHPRLVEAISTLGGRPLPQPSYVGVRR